MDQTKRRHDVAGVLVLVGGLLVTLSALERLSTPAVREIGATEKLIMTALLIIGVVIVILGACEVAGRPLLPSIGPSAIVGIGAMLAMADVLRILEDWFTFWGEKPLAVIPNSSFLFLFFGAVLSGGGAFLLLLGRTGVSSRAQPSRHLSQTGTSDLRKTYHANRWWMRDRSGSVLIWDDQAQAWSPWAHDTDPGLPPGWS